MKVSIKVLALFSLLSGTYCSLDFGAPPDPPMPDEARVRWIIAGYTTRRDYLWDVNDLDTIQRVTREILTDPGAPPTRLIPALLIRGQIGWPLEVPLLQAHIGHPSPAVRRAVIRSLGQTADRSSIPLILPFLTNPDRALRREAITALGKFGDPSVIRDMDTAAAPDPEFRRLAAEARRRIEASQEATPQALVDALIETDEYEDLMAVIVGVRPILQHMVANGVGSDRARQHATRLLSLTRSRSAAPFFLLRLLPGNDVREVRLEAIRGLGRTRFKKAVLQLISELTATDYEIQEATVISLGQIGHYAAIEPLLEAWQGNLLALRPHLHLALRRICATTGASLLTQYLKEGIEPGNVRVLVVDDELELTVGVSPDTLDSQLLSPDPVARRDAVLLLGMFGNAEDHSTLLVRSVVESDPEIRELARLAAERLKAMG